MNTPPLPPWRPKRRAPEKGPPANHTPGSNLKFSADVSVALANARERLAKRVTALKDMGEAKRRALVAELLEREAARKAGQK